MTEFPVERRNLLRTAGASAVGVGLASQSATAGSVAGGPTVYLGSGDEMSYAVDGTTGMREWLWAVCSECAVSSPRGGYKPSEVGR